MSAEKIEKFPGERDPSGDNRFRDYTNLEDKARVERMKPDFVEALGQSGREIYGLLTKGRTSGLGANGYGIGHLSREELDKFIELNPQIEVDQSVREALHTIRDLDEWIGFDKSAAA